MVCAFITSVRKQVYMHTCLSVYTQTYYMYPCPSHTHTCTCGTYCICFHMLAHKQTLHTYAHTHTHIHTHTTHTCTHMHTHAYTCIHTCAHKTHMHTHIHQGRSKTKNFRGALLKHWQRGTSGSHARCVKHTQSMQSMLSF